MRDGMVQNDMVQNDMMRGGMVQDGAGWCRMLVPVDMILRGGKMYRTPGSCIILGRRHDIGH